MFTLSVKQALFIQQCQLFWHRQNIDRDNLKIIRKQTKIPIDLDIDKQIHISKINEYIPRGGSLEKYLRVSKSIDYSNIDWYQAKRNGKLYH